LARDLHVETADILARRRFRFARSSVGFVADGGDFMSKLLRGLAAGWGAKKLGGGCISTILIFLFLWWLLGNFDVFR